MSQRIFAVSTDDTKPCGPWSPTTISIPGDDLEALRSLFAEHYPRHRIVEQLPVVMSGVMAPIALIVECRIKDAIDMSHSEALALLKLIQAAAILRLPQLADAMKEDEGYRASFFWDTNMKYLTLHLVCPNTYHVADKLFSALRGIALPAVPFSTAHKGFLTQDKILGCAQCVPLYMGPSFTVLECTGTDFALTTLPPQIGIKATSSVRSGSRRGGGEGPLTVMPSLPLGGVSGSAFGGMPSWLVPVDRIVEYFIRMIRNKTRDYDDICCDVAYTECGTLSEAAIWRIIGMRPRVGMRERSVRFLYWVAKRECPEEYEQWVFEQAAIIAHYFSNKAVTDEILQRLFMLKLEGDYISVIDGRDMNAAPTLYYFKNTWRVDKGMKHLGSAVSSLVTTFIGEELKEYMQRINQLDLYKALLTEVVRANFMTAMRNYTVKAASRMFAEEVQFDQDPDLFGCNNAVIQLGPHGAVARPGRPEDLVSKTNHLHYRRYDESECAEVKLMFRKLFLDRETRDWFFRLLSSMLCGSNPERSFYVMFGSAKNGKSGILNLLEIVFGDYFGRFSGKAFDERNDPSAASPELAAMHGMRVMAGSELKAGVQMESGIIKALTGDDGVQARGLFKDPKILRMRAKIIIASNHFPIFLHADKALRDRTVLIPLESRFSNFGVSKTEIEQFASGHFEAIENFRPTLQRLAPIVLSMLVESYSDYKLIGLSVKPKKVVELTEGYWHEVGVQTRFMADCIEFVDEVCAATERKEEKEGGSDDVLPVPASSSERPKLTYTAGYDRFIGWATARGVDISKYPRFTFKSLMDCEMASLSKHKIDFAVDGWIGCRLRKSSA